MSVLANYEPKSVFSYFEKLCTIPRGSGNTDGIASYLISFAKERGLESYRDAANNVIIRKPASAGYENADTIILQGHHDMVCEKNECVDFDFRFMWTAMTSAPRVQHWAATTVLLWQ